MSQHSKPTNMSEYTEQAEQFAAKHGVTLEVRSRRFGKYFDDDTQNRHVYELRLSRNNQHYDFTFGQSISESCVQTPRIKTEGPVQINVGLFKFVEGAGKFNGHQTGERKIVFHFQINTTISAIRAIQNNDEPWDSIINEPKFKEAVAKCHAILARRIPLDCEEESLRQVVERSISEQITKLERETTLWDENVQGEAPDMYSVLASLTKYDPVDFDNFCGDYGYDNDSRKAEKMYHAVVEEWKNVERLFGDVLDELQEIN